MVGTPSSGSRKDKIFRAAILRCLDGAKLATVDSLAEQVIATAMSDGPLKMQALKEIADRLDGKPAQAIVGPDDDEGNPTAIMLRIVDGAIKRD
jgi:hypothetical protein